MKELGGLLESVCDLAAILDNQVGTAREKWERNACTSFLIVDAQSVKNTDTASQKGYDAGKKVSGIKRHIAVDTQGLPHTIAVTTAEVTDRKGALQVFRRCCSGLGRVLADSGYVGEPFAQGVRDVLSETVAVQIARRSELHTFAVIPKRWVVPGWIRIGGCGKTVSVNSIPAYSLFTWHFW